MTRLIHVSVGNKHKNYLLTPIIILLTLGTLSAQFVLNNPTFEIFFTMPVDKKYELHDTYPFDAGSTSLKTRILELIDQAVSSIDVAMYNINDKSIIAALEKAKQKGVNIRFLADATTNNSALSPRPSFPVEMVTNDGGIMHNKFLIFDVNHPTLAAVLMGSTNFTSNGFATDANNMVLIRHQPLAQTYTIEFNEMWGSENNTPTSNKRIGKYKTDNTVHEFWVDGTKIESYFSPSDKVTQKINSALNSAQYSVNAGVYVFTHNTLAEKLIDLKNQQVKVKVIIDEEEWGSKLGYLISNGVDAQEHTPSSIFHHKYAIVDAAYADSDPLVITGSHNWTNAAENQNDENTLIIHNNAIAKAFLAEFNTRYCELAPWDCQILDNNTIPETPSGIFPTLAHNDLFIKARPNQTLKAYTIYTSLGAPVLFRQGGQDTSERIDVSTLYAGSYLIEILWSGGQSETYKFTKL